MSGAPPTYIGFAEYVAHVPRGIPAAVQRAASQLLSKRATRVAETPEWEQLRQIASDMRLHTLEHLDIYLERLEAQATAAGVKVHWARDAAEARVVVLDIARRHHVTSAVKSKSMATEEIGLNQALEDAGIEAIETDLGEYIVQLAGQRPVHIVTPAIHMSAADVGHLFAEKLGEPYSEEHRSLTDIARRHLREEYLQAGMGISGCNFAVADTGTMVVVENEGNAGLSTATPPLHVALIGIEKMLPR
ncbi:MAG TPA: LUD domain-containing protein, partial [Thermoleophilia bacterium]|nr:LUD domain-containing protein [Thermoleophilia bacterium]